METARGAICILMLITAAVTNRCHASRGVTLTLKFHNHGEGLLLFLFESNWDAKTKVITHKGREFFCIDS